MERSETNSCSFISSDEMKKTTCTPLKVGFIDTLRAFMDMEEALSLLMKYHVGTSLNYPSSTVFWQVDENMQVRSGKFFKNLQFLGNDFSPNPPFIWVHDALALPNFLLKECMFGEHLLKLGPKKPVAIVLKERTAIIAAYYFPKFIWLAIGSIENLNNETLSVLEGRIAYFFPDLKSYDLWSQKVSELTIFLEVEVSNFFAEEANHEEIEWELDLGDLLTREESRSAAIGHFYEAHLFRSSQHKN